MKVLFTTAFLLLGQFTTTLTQACAPGQPPLLAAARVRPGVRPLTRYLAAVLRLTPKQAAAVQRALRSRPAGSLTPEDLRASLSPVLSPDAQERLQYLQQDAASYRAMYYLAARH